MSRVLRAGVPAAVIWQRDAGGDARGPACSVPAGGETSWQRHCSGSLHHVLRSACRSAGFRVLATRCGRGRPRSGGLNAGGADLAAGLAARGRFWGKDTCKSGTKTEQMIDGEEHIKYTLGIKNPGESLADGPHLRAFQTVHRLVRRGAKLLRVRMQIPVIPCSASRLRLSGFGKALRQRHLLHFATRFSRNRSLLKSLLPGNWRFAPERALAARMSMANLTLRAGRPCSGRRRRLACDPRRERARGLGGALLVVSRSTLKLASRIAVDGDRPDQRRRAAAEAAHRATGGASRITAS